jgi:hypothetical protein
MKDVERDQVAGSTDAQLRDRLAALRRLFDPQGNGGWYPAAQLRELHLIQDELRDRDRERFTDADRPDETVADNHEALDRATDVERYR